MTQYIINYGNGTQNIIEIEVKIDNISENELFFQLPAWRPGRYELGNFGQNMFPLHAFDQNNKQINCSKVTKDRWKINCENVTKITLHYQYAAVIKNAGGTFKSPNQLVITPVNCLIYAENLINSPCTISLNIPKDFNCVSSAPNFSYKNYYELAASPIVCSTKTQIETIVIEKINFHILFEGNVIPDWKKIKTDFSLFIKEQLTLFGNDFPSTDYYFLNLIFEEQHYHGVEHLNSTLIALGPDSAFHDDAFYSNFLGISSHELFHYWNICRIRPLELSPYDYTKETYFETGYIAEGVTTYYGDYLLGRSKCISIDECLKELSTTLTRHLSNPARHVVSIAESSIDLWLDGYKQGIEGRKVSIYAKGASIAFLLDLWIRKSTSNLKSLDDVMLLMWQNHGKIGKGYTSQDYRNYIETVSDTNAQWFFDDFVYGTKLIESILQPLLLDFGLMLCQSNNSETKKLEWKLEIIEDLDASQKANFGAWMKV
jgi:predicted metalloprotease with PDZ domain